MRTFAVVVAIFFGSASVQAGDAPFQDWIFPGATPREQDVNPVNVTSADKQHVQSVACGYGQYLTDKPFHEVVLFYARKSGIKNPNSIYAREFPGTEIYMPSHTQKASLKREEPSFTLLHFIREDVATAHLMMTDHPELGFISVSISRSRNDEQTLVQLINHTSKRVHNSTDKTAKAEPTN